MFFMITEKKHATLLYSVLESFLTWMSINSLNVWYSVWVKDSFNF